MHPLIAIKAWPEAEQFALPVRMTVFVGEQGIPAELEVDESDATAQHTLAFRDEMCVGTARLVLLPGGIGRIGRMAVLSGYRKQGIGGLLIGALLEYGKDRRIFQFELHAQLQAIPFYEQFQFIAHGEPYEEVGMLHRDMIHRIATPTEID